MKPRGIHRLKSGGRGISPSGVGTSLRPARTTAENSSRTVADIFAVRRMQ